jgi:hypothetical protein
MKRAALLLLVAPILLVARPIPARAQAYNNKGVLSVMFFLRASLNDVAVVCSDHDFRDSTEAYAFARAIGPKLGFGTGTVEYDRFSARDCVSVFPDDGLTRPGPKPHERVFRFDGNPVVAFAKKEFQLELMGIDVCTPELPTTIPPTTGQERFGGGTCDHPFQQSYSWFSDEYGSVPVINVSFRATPASLLRGLLGQAAFWGLVVLGLMFLFRSMSRRSWRLFVKHRVVAWIPTAILMLGLIFCAVFIAPYWTNWIPSLQLYAHIGIGGEAALVWLPVLALGTVMIAGPIRGAAKYRANQPDATFTFESGSVEIPRLEWGPRNDLRTFLPSVAQIAPFIGIVILISSGRNKNLWFVGVGLLASVFFADDLWAAFQIRASMAADVTSRQTLLRGELRNLDIEMSHFYTTERPIVGQPNPWTGAAIAPIGIYRRRLTLLKHMEGLPPGVLAGATIDSIRMGAWLHLPYVVILVAITGPRDISGGIRALIAGVVLLVVASRIGATLIRRGRAYRLAVQSPRKETYLRGLIMNRWVTARLMAPRSWSGWQRGLLRVQPSVRLWKASRRAISRFAARANIPPERVQAIVQGVMSTDLG